VAELPQKNLLSGPACSSCYSMLLLEECGGSSLVRQTLYRTSTRQHSIRFPSPHGLPGMRAAKRPLPALSSQQQGQLLVRLWAANCPAETRLQPSANPVAWGLAEGANTQPPQHTGAPPGSACRESHNSRASFRSWTPAGCEVPPGGRAACHPPPVAHRPPSAAPLTPFVCDVLEFEVCVGICAKWRVTIRSGFLAQYCEQIS
jgi:hypothetical protein